MNPCTFFFLNVFTLFTSLFALVQIDHLASNEENESINKIKTPVLVLLMIDIVYTMMFIATFVFVPFWKIVCCECGQNDVCCVYDKIEKNPENMKALLLLSRMYDLVVDLLTLILLGRLLASTAHTSDNKTTLRMSIFLEVLSFILSVFLLIVSLCPEMFPAKIVRVCETVENTKDAKKVVTNVEQML